MNSVFSRHLARRFFFLFTLGMSLALLAALPHSGYSAPAAVTRYVGPGGFDGNNCLSLVTACEHIQAAINKSASGDIIQIAAGTYLENLTISDKSLALLGAGSATTIIDGSNQERVLLLTDDDTATPMTVVISGLTLQHGKSELGGAISNETVSIHLTVSNSEIVNNTATAAGGGGVFNNGFLNLTNVVIRDNTANSDGGAIYNLGYLELGNSLVKSNLAPGGGGISNQNTVTVTSSSIISNTGSGNGGGIYNRASTSKLVLQNSMLSGNTAIAGDGGAIFNRGILTSTTNAILGNTTTNAGGGIYNDTSGQIILVGNRLQNNTSVFEGGGLFNSGTAYVDRMSMAGNKSDSAGGGVHNTSSGKITISSSTIVTNTSTGSAGGGINNAGTLTLTQSALVYNVASTEGGGLNNTASAQLTNVTISDNAATSGGGIQNSGTLSLQFSTISENSAPSLSNAGGSVTSGKSILAQGVGSACAGAITSLGYNIDRGSSCSLSGTQDLSNTDPLLGPLQNNGGNTPTRAIDFSSPAVDSAGTCPPPTTDQRSVARPKGNACDRGAYEVVGYPSSGSVSISSNQCVTSSVTINDQFAIGRMLVGVNLAYPDRANLTIRLLSPGSTKGNLLGPGAASGQNLDVLFDDSAPGPVPPGDQNPAPPSYTPAYRPATPLSNFRGVGIKGTWKLEICNASPAAGTLNSWVLIVPEVSDFKVYLPLVRR
jgi:subtilisin-like proprotein convertase family protein